GTSVTHFALAELVRSHRRPLAANFCSFQLARACRDTAHEDAWIKVKRGQVQYVELQTSRTEQISTAEIGRERGESSGRHYGGALPMRGVSRSRGGQPATGTGLLMGWGATRAASLSHQKRARTIYLSI